MLILIRLTVTPNSLSLRRWSAAARHCTHGAWTGHRIHTRLWIHPRLCSCAPRSGWRRARRRIRILRAGIRVRIIRRCRARHAHAWRDRGRRPPRTRGLTTARYRSLRRRSRRIPTRCRSLCAAGRRRSALGSLSCRLGGNRCRRPNWIGRRRHVWRRRSASVCSWSWRRGSSRVRRSRLRRRCRCSCCSWWWRRRSDRRRSPCTLRGHPTGASQNCDKQNKPFYHGILLAENKHHSPARKAAMCVSLLSLKLSRKARYPANPVARNVSGGRLRPSREQSERANAITCSVVSHLAGAVALRYDSGCSAKQQPRSGGM
jgi:hypothetical protein